MSKERDIKKIMGAMNKINGMMSVEVRERALDSATNLISSLNESMELAQSLEGQERIDAVTKIKEQLLAVLINSNAFGKWIPKEHNEVLKEEMWKILRAN
ncbi:MAG: hypothetical protein ACX93O_00025 [Flagellimonas sp.]